MEDEKILPEWCLLVAERKLELSAYVQSALF